jgi:hypothetical protein
VELAHDREYFRRRAAEERALAFSKENNEEAEIAGQLALAYSALARKGADAEPAVEVLQD